MLLLYKKPTIEYSSNCSTSHGNPDIGGKTDHNHANHRATTSCQQYWLSANPIWKSTPEHARQGLRQRKGWDEQACVEWCITFITDLELLDKWPGIWKDRCECDWLCKTDNCWKSIQISSVPSTTDSRPTEQKQLCSRKLLRVSIATPSCLGHCSSA